MAVTTTYSLAAGEDGGTSGIAAPAFTEVPGGGFAFVSELTGSTSGGLYFDYAADDSDAFAAAITGTDPSVTRLSNGNYLVTATNGTAVEGTVFGPTGSLVIAATNLANTSTFPGSNSVVGEAVAVDSGGFVMIVTVEFATDDDQYLAFHDGSLSRTALIPLETSPGTTSSPADIAVLDNGNVAVAWHLEGTGMRTAVYTQTGTVVQNLTTFDTGGTSFGNAAAVATDDGGFAILYQSNADGTGGLDIRQANFNAAGVLQGIVNITNPTLATSSANETNVAAVRLPDGNIGLTWEVDGDVFTQIVSQVGGESASNIFEVSGASPTSDTHTNADITHLIGEDQGQGRLLLVAMENTTDGTLESEAVSIIRRQVGDAGNDNLNATIYQDSLTGGAGIDTVSYASEIAGITANLATGTGAGAALGDRYAGIENLTGSDFADTLLGDDNDNVLKGAGGADTLNGGAGNDTLVAGNIGGDTAANTLFGGAGNDTMLGGTGVDTFFGGAGTDSVTYAETVDVTFDLRRSTFTGQAAQDVFDSIEGVTTGSGNDFIEGGAENNLLNGGAGNDTIRGFNGDDTLFGGDGDDFAEGGSGNTGSGTDTVYGGAGNDTLRGDQGADSLYGDDGNDNLRAGRGADFVYGGAGDDYVDADGIADGDNADRDSLFGGEGNDRLVGSDGPDYLGGGAGNDSMSGGLGNDFYIVDAAGDSIGGELAFSLGGGIDTVRAFIDYVQPDNIELVRLGNIDGTANLNATGNDAPGTLVGNAGNNVLSGRGGNDQINGNGGDDRLTGNTGRDTLVGGAGADTFIYSSISESRVGSAERDVINGFDRGVDRIDLSAMDANLAFAGEGVFTLIGNAGFTGDGFRSAGELRLQGLGGPNAVLVEGDLRGDGVADFQIFVNLTTILSAEDFIL